MIKTADELRARLDGKTEYSEIETILNGATIGAMKGYIVAERYDICTGRNLLKADYVKALTSVVYSLVPEENPASVADENVIRFLEKLIVSDIDAEICVRVMASLSLYEKITSTSEPHKFSNLPEAEIRMMLGFEANYMRLGDERGMYGLFTNDLNTVNVTDTAKAARYFEELILRTFHAYDDKATAQTVEETKDEEKTMIKTAEEDSPCECVKTYNEEMTVFAEITAEVMSENETQAPAQEAKITQPEALYEEDAYADNGGDNSAQEQDIPEAHVPDERPAPVRRQHPMRVILLANKYAEARGTVEAILKALKIFRNGRNVRARQGFAIDVFDDVIKEVREKYREWRIECFKLRRKLLRVMSASEIRLACEEYIARCEE